MLFYHLTVLDISISFQDFNTDPVQNLLFFYLVSISLENWKYFFKSS